MKTVNKTLLACLALTFSIVSVSAGVKKTADTTFTFTSSDHIKMPVKIIGKGAPCMFVPGGPGGGYLSFEKLGGDNLGRYLTMIYADQRGSGSAQNAKDYSLNRMLKDIDELRAKLHIDKMYLMSHSFGGIILVNYALKYPQHVKGIILVNSTLHFFSKESLMQQIDYGFKLLGKDTTIKSQNSNELFKTDASVRQRLNKKHLGYKFLTDDISTIKALDHLDSIYPRTNDFALAVLGPYLDKSKPMVYPEYFKDYTPSSANINCPALVISGTRDHAVGPGHYKLFRFPHQKTVIINSGHLLYYENNKEFVTAVGDFIKAIKN